MNSQSLPFRADTASGFRATSIGLWGTLGAAALVAWYSAGVAVFAPNRYMMAFWFVLTRMFPLLVAFSVGWFCRTLLIGTRTRSVPVLLGLHLGALLLAIVVLPLVLSVVNLLPFGQSTGSWRGRITAYDELYFTSRSERNGATITVNSDSVGPGLRFRIPSTDADTIADAPRSLPEVGGNRRPRLHGRADRGPS